MELLTQTFVPDPICLVMDCPPEDSLVNTMKMTAAIQYIITGKVAQKDDQMIAQEGISIIYELNGLVPVNHEQVGSSKSFSWYQCATVTDEYGPDITNYRWPRGVV